ncbi:uncharacterized protein LOC112458460 [Temnothorax curvispinosus]|uniref:Uncharacterized protein LOC112458460 n=1 Tax=Temnothorax curvispinosus TaxID=300111 RepID=A0A6J1Q6N5_9HYME|nr:uncharacterized protein LOC112458460 [Temnothorax curvispinosus]
MSVNIIRIKCSITAGAYSNGRSVHAIHEFAPKVLPGYKLSETPTQIIYLSIVARNITNITVQVVDQKDRLIDFRGEKITIRLHQQDLYTLPCDSFLYVEGRFNDDGATNEEQYAKLVNNCVAFMYDEIRYELDGVEIDRCRNVVITSTIKNYVSLTIERARRLQNAGWSYPTSESNLNNASYQFNFCVPLNILLGFCEDYRRVVINARHELILRSRSDHNCVVDPKKTVPRDPAKDPKITLLKVQWRMPHVALNDSTTKHSWAVKAAPQLEKPRYVIFALQTGRQNEFAGDASRIDHCALANVKLYLNSEFYPYDDVNVDFESDKFAVLYEMYAKFRGAYYGDSRDDALFSPREFARVAPLAVINCSRQNKSVKSATVDVRIQFENKENVPPKTTAFCLIVHDRVIEYSPLTNVVRKII